MRKYVTYFIERTDTHEWYYEEMTIDKDSFYPYPHDNNIYIDKLWTNDPLKAKRFIIADYAKEYLNTIIFSTDIDEKLLIVTEHSFYFE